MTTFTEDDLDKLSAPHVQRAMFARVDLPSGERRLHTGMGRIEIGGHVWEGVSDPFGSQMVSLDSVEEPWFGHAPAVDVVVSGANKEFLKQMWDDREALDGAECDLSFAMFDAETGDIVLDLAPMVPGKITAPHFAFAGSDIRYIQIRIVSDFEGMNFPATEAAWSPAGQRSRYPGDEGLDLIAAQIVEYYKP